MNAGRPWLLVAAWSSVAGSLLHVAAIVGGPDWYRFLGAGERIARAVERGSSMPTIVTIGIAAIIAGWAIVAFCAAGVVKPLTLIRVALVAISVVLVARGVLGFTPVFLPIPSMMFKLTSAAICLLMGACFAMGTWRAWPQLSLKEKF